MSFTFVLVLAVNGNIANFHVYELDCGDPARRGMRGQENRDSDHRPVFLQRWHPRILSPVCCKALCRHASHVSNMSDSMSSTPTSEASTKVDLDAGQSYDDHKGFHRRAWWRAKHVTVSRDIFAFLVAFRILNALSTRTFFQPDEYFQSLEPAWKIAFGEDGGAWITWVGLRRFVALQSSSWLTGIIGMEAPPQILDSSIPFRWRLLAFRKARRCGTCLTILPSRALGGSTKSHTSPCRCAGRLLYLEAWRKSVRARQPTSMGFCT